MSIFLFYMIPRNIFYHIITIFATYNFYAIPIMQTDRWVITPKPIDF